MNKYKASIDFHSDLDGLISATLMLDYLLKKSNLIEDIETDVCLTPVDYDEAETWKSNPLPDANLHIIVDFEIHPDVLLSDTKKHIWIDHHSSRKDVFKEDLNNSTRIVDGDAPSCAGLIYDFLYEKYDYLNPKFREIVINTNIIDSASFLTNSDPFKFDDPYIALFNAIEHSDGKNDFLRYVCKKFVLEEDIKFIINNDPRLISSIENVRNRTIAGFQKINEKKKIIRRDDVVFSIWIEPKTIDPSYCVTSFMIYNQIPNVDISIMISPISEELYKIGLSLNPFKLHNESVDRLHLGNFIGKYGLPGSGGHSGAAGGTIKRNNFRNIMNKLFIMMK